MLILMNQHEIKLCFLDKMICLLFFLSFRKLDSKTSTPHYNMVADFHLLYFFLETNFVTSYLSFKTQALPGVGMEGGGSKWFPFRLDFFFRRKVKQ